MMKIHAAIALFVALLLVPVTGHAQDKWVAQPLEDGSTYANAARETRPPAPSGIPDMLLASGPAGGDIAQAWYAQPTGRYRHGVLGDRIEAGMLTIRLKSGRVLRYRLPETEVFEDIAPRIADLDGDGSMEIITILSSVRGGASITIFGLSGSALVRKATTGFLGRANRWLNIAAISNFTGGRLPEIAFVATPHIGGRLGILKYVPNGLINLAAANDFSNHVIGSPELRLSAVADINGDGRADLALPSADRRRLRIMSLTSAGLTELAQASLPSAIDKAVIATGAGKDTAFLMGAEDGRIYSVSRRPAGDGR